MKKLILPLILAFSMPLWGQAGDPEVDSGGVAGAAVSISVLNPCGKNTTTPTTTPNWSASCNQNLTGGNKLFVACVSGSTGASTISDSLGNFTGAAMTLDALTNNLLHGLYTITTGGADTVTITTTSSNAPVCFSLEIQGLPNGVVDQTGTAANQASSTTWTLPSITTLVANEIVIGWGGQNSTNNTFTQGTGYTIPPGTCVSNAAGACGQGSGGNQSGFIEYKIVSSTGSYAPTVTLTAMTGTANTVSYK